jgi:hypothetical protein
LAAGLPGETFPLGRAPLEPQPKTAATSAIPYHGSRKTANSRRSGLAALTMVLESLGRQFDRRALWRAIARSDARGQLAARTSLLAQSALDHGLAAIVVQARAPWLALRRCAEGRARVILNHRVHRYSPWGNYSVLVGVEGSHAVLHDPEIGPDRRVRRENLLRLWSPIAPVCEIAGYTLVAVEPRRRKPSPKCPACGVAVPGAITCPTCARPVLLRPAAPLGCVAEGCPERLWTAVYCPYCDGRIERVESVAAAGFLRPVVAEPAKPGARRGV